MAASSDGVLAGCPAWLQAVFRDAELVAHLPRAAEWVEEAGAVQSDLFDPEEVENLIASLGLRPPEGKRLRRELAKTRHVNAKPTSGPQRSSYPFEGWSHGSLRCYRSLSRGRVLSLASRFLVKGEDAVRGE